MDETSDESRLWSQPSSTDGEPVAALRYLLLADISGYTRFLAGVEDAHGVDFSAGVPAGYEILDRLLRTVIDGVDPTFQVVKVEGDAVFATAPASSLDGRGPELLLQLRAAYAAFSACRIEASSATDHRCTSCDAVSGLDLKMVLHRGHAVRQRLGQAGDVIGPAVTLAHRLLKNTVRQQIGLRPYLLVTAAAADALGLSEVGLRHLEAHPDAGTIQTRILDLVEEPAGATPLLWVGEQPERPGPDPLASSPARYEASAEPPLRARNSG